MQKIILLYFCLGVTRIYKKIKDCILYKHIWEDIMTNICTWKPHRAGNVLDQLPTLRSDQVDHEVFKRAVLTDVFSYLVFN